MSDVITEAERESLLGIYRGLIWLRRNRKFLLLDTVYALRNKDVTYIESQLAQLESASE